MRFKPNRGRSLITAKNFTIAMVVVNAAGLLAVQQKLKQSEIPDAYALDDGAQPVLARSDAVLPERRALPEIALSQTPPPLPPESLPALPAIKSLPVIDLATLDLVPVAAHEQASVAQTKSGIALAIDKPAQTRSVPKRPDIAVPSAKPARVDNFSSTFDPGFEASAPIGLSMPGEGFEFTVAAAPIGAQPSVGVDAEVAAPPPIDLAPPATSLTAPTLAPAADEAAPAVPSEEEPAELPAAA